jgi:hypothetical protein
MLTYTRNVIGPVRRCPNCVPYMPVFTIFAPARIYHTRTFNSGQVRWAAPTQLAKHYYICNFNSGHQHELIGTGYNRSYVYEPGELYCACEASIISTHALLYGTQALLILRYFHFLCKAFLTRRSVSEFKQVTLKWPRESTYSSAAREEDRAGRGGVSDDRVKPSSSHR